jgi:dihydroorotase-like cyclic amidohydrolase
VGDELLSLVEEKDTSFKIYMTYDDLKLDDRQILECLAMARRKGAKTMIRPENADCIAWLTEALEVAGHRHSVRPVFASMIGLQHEIIPPAEMARIVGAYSRADMKHRMTRYFCQITPTKSDTTYDNFVRDFGERYTQG